MDTCEEDSAHVGGLFFEGGGDGGGFLLLQGEAAHGELARDIETPHVAPPEEDGAGACVPHLDVAGFRSELMCAFDREGSSRDCQAFVITCIGLRGQSGTLQTQSGLLGRMRETVLTAELSGYWLSCTQAACFLVCSHGICSTHRQ